MREGRKEEASKVKQTTRQSNTAHPRQSLFLRKIAASGGTRTDYTLDMYIYKSVDTGCDCGYPIY